jgi:hypothetical protein
MRGEFQELVDERGRGLRSKSRAELLDLQYLPTEKVEINGQRGTISLIVEEETEGSLRVVVQGFLDTKSFPRIGVKHVALDGFRMDPNGNLSELRDEEFNEFD